MPCLLKRATATSPAVATFTHNELFYGVIGRSRRVREFLDAASSSGHWFFGIHVQGDCSHLERWPLERWQSFFMWPDAQASFLRGVPEGSIVDRSCINFLPAVDPSLTALNRRWDLCIISRPSPIKRIAESLYLVKAALQCNPELRVIFVVPDYRKFRSGERTYANEGLDRRFYELPMSLFSARELRQISFLSSSVESFGRFPIAQDVLQSLLAQSKFMLLTSHSEGTPRVIAEALMLGTPCMLSPALRSGLGAYLTPTNSVYVDDDPARGAEQICDALVNYSRFAVDARGTQALFSDAFNRGALVQQLTDQLTRARHAVDGEWLLDDLHLRLAGHGRKRSLQVMNNPDLLFRWFDNVARVDPYDEDHVFGQRPMADTSRIPGIRRYLDAVRSRLAI